MASNEHRNTHDRPQEGCNRVYSHRPASMRIQIEADAKHCDDSHCDLVVREKVRHAASSDT
jgi:hypothetical protein